MFLYVLTYLRAEPGKSVLEYSIGGVSAVGEVGMLFDARDGLLGNEFGNELIFDFNEEDDRDEALL